TMNNAHGTHFTDEPEEGITHVLKGWPSEPGQTEDKHDGRFKDMRVWNVPTNARDWGTGAARINGNSIFIYSVGDLCIAHLGHLHHRLTKEHLEELGRIDVLMVPIDGSFTMGVPYMADVIKSIDPKIVLPMHYWGKYQLDRFMGLMAPLEPDFVWPDRRSIEVVKQELPEKLTVIAVAGEGVCESELAGDELAERGGLRPGEQLGGRAALPYLALVHEHHEVGHPARE